MVSVAAVLMSFSDLSIVFCLFLTNVCSQGASYSGFLWDSSSGIELKDAAVLVSPVVNGNRNHTYPQLYLAHFSVSYDEFHNTQQHLTDLPIYWVRIGLLMKNIYSPGSVAHL